MQANRSGCECVSQVQTGERRSQRHDWSKDLPFISGFNKRENMSSPTHGSKVAG